jgi:hypothetical protein
MADRTSNADRFTRDPQRRITSATAIGINALKPIMHFQVSMLRIWADSIERFAGNYQKGLEETDRRGTVKQGTRRVKQRNGLDEPLWGQT